MSSEVTSPTSIEFHYNGELLRVTAGMMDLKTRCWKASGEFRGRLITAKGQTAEQAIDAWKRRLRVAAH